MGHILIIDDEESPREELRDRIEVMGHTVEQTDCVEGALEALAKMSHDCILLDLAIPRRYGGPINLHHGINLLNRIVATGNAPPVIVITANGLNDHQLSTNVFESGAKAFLAKPFSGQPVEEKITRVIAARRESLKSANMPRRTSFSGGNLVQFDDRIELCGTVVGGTKSNALIRMILPELARRKADGRRIRSSRAELVAVIGNGRATEAGVGNAIQDFRKACKERLGCGMEDVIATGKGGGYQLVDGINFQIGEEERAPTQAAKDQDTVMKELRRFKTRTCRQIADRVGLPQSRVKLALSKLEDSKRISRENYGTNTTYRICEDADKPPAATKSVARAKKAAPARAKRAR